MSRKKTSRQEPPSVVQHKPRRKLIVTIAVALSLLAGGAVLALRRGPATQSDGNGGPVTMAGLTPGSPSKEYIHAGGRLVATEEPCNSISPTVKFLPSSGGSGSVTVTAPSGCAWTIVASDNWIVVKSLPEGTGSGVVAYELRQNPSGTRVGTITIGSQVFTITQGGLGCQYPIAPTDVQSFPKSGGDGTATVTAASGCGWIAVSNAAWITIISGSNGSGNGTVSYTVALNSTGSARVGTISIANRTLTVKQKP